MGETRKIEEILEDILTELRRKSSSRIDPYTEYMAHERIAEHKKRKKEFEERNKRRIRG